MSCGRPHDLPCTEALALVYAYLDGELGEPGCAEVRKHLDECGPCLREFGLEEAVKRLIARHCGHDQAPEDLRSKVMGRIRQVRYELEVTEFRVD
jgi:mycothiol system anti-sigma-R factor